MNIYQRLVRLPKAINDLLTGQIDRLIQEKQELEWDIAEIEAMPDGYHVWVSSGNRMPKDEWVAHANVVLADKEAEILKLQGHQ